MPLLARATAPRAMLPAKAEWQRLEMLRQPYIQRAQDAASLTLPYLFPPTFSLDGSMIGNQTAALHLPTPFQSVGARGVNNVASKFVLGLIPPNSPFFRMQIERFLFEQEFGAEMLGAAEQSLVVIENTVMNEIETMQLRPVVHENVLHLAVGGNGMLEIPDSGPAIFWPLSSYVVERDPAGELMRLLIRIEIALERLPLRARQAALAADAVRSVPGQDVAHQPVRLFTRAERMGEDRWMGWQEFENGSMVPGTRGVWDSEDFPYVVTRWNRVAGEHYARGLVEQYLGDLRSLEGLMQAIVQASASAAHHVWLVNPNGPSRAEDIQGAPTGAFRAGREEDFSSLKLDKGADLAVAWKAADRLEERLSRAMLEIQGAVRDSERTTLGEVQETVQELQENMGGTFATMHDELQLPIVRRVIGRLTRRRALPVLPRRVVTPKIITGLEGIGRGAEAARLIRGFQAVRANLGDEALETIDRREGVDRILTGLGIQTEGLLLSEEQVAQNTSRGQLQQLLQSGAGGQLVNQIGQLTRQGQGEAA